MPTENKLLAVDRNDCIYGDYVASLGNAETYRIIVVELYIVDIVWEMVKRAFEPVVLT